LVKPPPQCANLQTPYLLRPPRGQRGGEVTAKPEDLVTWRSGAAAQLWIGFHPHDRFMGGFSSGKMMRG